MEGKYIWEKVINSIDENNYVLFEDWSKEYFTDRQLEYIVTDEPKDATEFQKLVATKVTSEIMPILEKHNVKQKDVQAILETVISSFNEAIYEAIWRAFWTYDENAHYSHSFSEIKVSDINYFRWN